MRTFLWSVLLGVLHAVACWQFPLVGTAALFATLTLTLADRDEPLFNVRATKADSDDEEDADDENSTTSSSETETDADIPTVNETAKSNKTQEANDDILSAADEDTTTKDDQWGGEASAESTAAKIARQAAGKAAWKRRHAIRKRPADSSLSPKSNSDVIAAWHARKRVRRRIDL